MENGINVSLNHLHLVKAFCKLELLNLIEKNPHMLKKNSLGWPLNTSRKIFLKNQCLVISFYLQLSLVFALQTLYFNKYTKCVKFVHRSNAPLA